MGPHTTQTVFSWLIDALVILTQLMNACWAQYRLRQPPVILLQQHLRVQRHVLMPMLGQPSMWHFRLGSSVMAGCIGMAMSWGYIMPGCCWIYYIIYIYCICCICYIYAGSIYIIYICTGYCIGYCCIIGCCCIMGCYAIGSGAKCGSGIIFASVVFTGASPIWISPLTGVSSFVAIVYKLVLIIKYKRFRHK